MYIGAVLELNKFKFELIDADEYTYMYLEKHADEVTILATSEARRYKPIVLCNSFSQYDVIVRPQSTVGYTSVVASVIRSRQWSN